jgi:hypothetical protein
MIRVLDRGYVEILGSLERSKSHPLVTNPRHGRIYRAGDGGEITPRAGPMLPGP